MSSASPAKRPSSTAELWRRYLGCMEIAARNKRKPREHAFWLDEADQFMDRYFARIEARLDFETGWESSGGHIYD